MVVLAEEHDRGIVDRGVVEGFVGVALAGGSVAEVGDDSGAVFTECPVPLHTHRIPGGVQHLVADDDRVEVEVVLVRVPAPVGDAAEHGQ